MRHVRQLTVAAVWGLLITVGAMPVLAGQSSTNSARIEGRVTDDSGAVLPGVTVSIASPALQAPQLDTTTDENGREISELFVLATTLLDVNAYPAMALAELYHLRWQAETGIGDLKTAVRGGPEVLLRSKTPAMVEQEFWAMLCVYQAIRELISYAAPTGLDPGRVSFKRAFQAARDSVTRPALSPRPH